MAAQHGCVTRWGFEGAPGYNCADVGRPSTAVAHGAYHLALIAFCRRCCPVPFHWWLVCMWVQYKLCAPLSAALGAAVAASSKAGSAHSPPSFLGIGSRPGILCGVSCSRAGPAVPPEQGPLETRHTTLCMVLLYHTLLVPLHSIWRELPQDSRAEPRSCIWWHRLCKGLRPTHCMPLRQLG